jgi:hypothetical protein
MGWNQPEQTWWIAYDDYPSKYKKWPRNVIAQKDILGGLILLKDTRACRQLRKNQVFYGFFQTVGHHFLAYFSSMSPKMMSYRGEKDEKRRLSLN